MADRKQLVQLTRPFVDRFVHSNPSGQGRGSYVGHDVVTQRLLQIIGPFDFQLVEILRGDLKGNKELANVVVGAVCRLTVEVDGRTVTVEEVGDCENPTNWPHDGARMKDAMSDAIKRCAMRLGLGLHLWAQDEYYVHDALRRDFPDSAVAADADPREQLELVAPAEAASAAGGAG